MSRPRVELCQEERSKLLKARYMRCKGARFSEIAHHLGVKERWLRYHIKENEQVPRVAITKEELERRQALIPIDTRDLTARICGDPIPNDPRR